MPTDPPTDAEIEQALKTAKEALRVKPTPGNVASFGGWEVRALHTLASSVRRLIGERDAARKENDALRFAYANSSASCFYCQLPASRMSECERGFPGCGRADDMMNGPPEGHHG